MSEAARMIVRVAGLPVEILEDLSGGVSFEAVEGMLRLENELRQARSELVEKAYGELLAASPEIRPLLLAIKRDCFNGRRLGKHTCHPHWEMVDGILDPLSARILDLEALLEGQATVVRAAYKSEEARQRHVLLKILEDPELLRGVALASSDLLHSMTRLDRITENGFGRKEKRVESSLIRYISRAAVKLSPFSTLTRVALGGVDAESTGNRELRLLGAGWPGHSLVRVRRQPLNRLCEILALHPVFRRGLEVVLNNTVEPIGPDRYRLLRPSYWGLDNKTGEYQFVQDSMVRVSLNGPMIAWLIDQLPIQRRTYGDLVEALMRRFRQGSPENIVRLLDDFLRVGFLKIVMPWPANTIVVEEALAKYLRSLPPDPLLGEVCAWLDLIERMRNEYSGSPEPARLVDEIDQALVAIWNLVKPLVGLPPEAQCTWLRRHNLNEDVLLVPRNRGQKILALSPSAADEICRRLESLGRISNLFSHRYDVLHTIAEFARQRWPRRSNVGFLEFYEEFQALWRQCTEFYSTISSSSGPLSFNPLQLGEIEYLHDCRQRVSRSWRDCMAEHKGESVLSQDKVDALAGSLPDLYGPIGYTCFFIQPADSNGDSWVLNRMLDGLGRYSSRYTPLFDEEAYHGYLRSCCAVYDRGETSEFVDLMCCSQGDNLNVHLPHSPRVIEIPGERSDFPSSNRLSLRDLTVDWTDNLPRLLDPAGRHLIPVHLGPVSLRLMPSLVRLLAVFGSSDFGLVLPPRNHRQEIDVEVSDRLRLGNVILRRRRWTLPLDAIKNEVRMLSDDDFFMAINRWRIERGIPDRVFLEEKIPVKFFDRNIFKPQYMDFTSPLFVRILRPILQAGPAQLSAQEMLPDTQSAIRDAGGQRWAIELQLDASASGRIAVPSQPSPSPFIEGLCLGGHRLPEKGDGDGGEAGLQ